MTAVLYIAILVFMVQCHISNFMESTMKTKSTASVSYPNGAIDQSGQQEVLTVEAKNVLLEEAEQPKI